MVYEVKCSECGKIIDFGGSEPSDFSAEEKLPEDAIEWQGDIYCKECVSEFVRFGVGEVEERLDKIEESLKEALKALGLEDTFDQD